MYLSFSLVSQPQEVGIQTHEYSKDSKDSELVNKRISEEMFDSIIREVIEEIGVPTTSLVSDSHFVIGAASFSPWL